MGSTTPVPCATNQMVIKLRIGQRSMTPAVTIFSGAYSATLIAIVTHILRTVGKLIAYFSGTLTICMGDV